MFAGWRCNISLANTVEHVGWWKSSIGCAASEALTKAGGMIEYIIGGRLSRALLRSCVRPKAGKVPRTCGSHLEGSL